MTTKWASSHFLVTAHAFADMQSAEESDRRSAALLARTAVERALNDFWMARRPDMTHCNHTTQLLCLSEFAGNDVAATVEYAWRTLSDLCHYRAYEITPAATDVANALRAADDAVRALQTLPT